MKQSFTIYGQLPALNTVIGANRANKYVGAKLKRETQDRIRSAIRSERIIPFKGAVRLSMTFYEPNKKRDPDNVFSAVKFILDALTAEGIIEGDSQKFLPPPKPIEFFYAIDRDRARVAVQIEGVDPDG